MEGRALSHLELMTLAHKDEQYYDNWIGGDLQELAQRYFGIRRWIQLRNAITVLSRFGYFAAASLANIPTLGEEFCEAQAKMPSFLKRFSVIMLNNELQLPKEFPKSYAKLIKDVHMATFFLFGDFYELSKRACNYIYLTGDTNLYQTTKIDHLYRLLGCMSLAKLLIDILKETQQDEEKQQQSVTQEPTSTGIDRSCVEAKKEADAITICHLCSARRTEPTSTLCGHIFCWDCIHKWLRERNECPICRTPTEPSRLIHLINFK